jgi:hypothetical protein
MSYFRYDYRTTTSAIAADAGIPTNIQLQCTGLEPMILSVTGGDVNFSYTADMGNVIKILEDTIITFDNQHPFGDQIFCQTPSTGDAATVTFMIGGGIQNGKRI